MQPTPACEGEDALHRGRERAPGEPLGDGRQTLGRLGAEDEADVALGDRHLFADDSLPDYDESAATLLRQRVLGFLDDVG